jgi:hypothetical protein
VDLPRKILSAEPEQCSRWQTNFFPEVREQYDPA